METNNNHRKVMESKVGLVTGASRGIGKGVALELARNNYTVYITGRSIETLREVVNEAATFGCREKICPIQCDHTNDYEVKKLFQTIEEYCDGRLDLLVNNAYSAAKFVTDHSSKPFWDQPLESWDILNNVGMRNHYMCSVLAARMMVKRKTGLIINISSIGGAAYMLTPPYGIGKCALDRMASDCASDLRKYNVAFVSLRPCAVKTEFFMNMMRSGNSSISKSNEAQYFSQHGESTRFVGKAVIHLSNDVNKMSKSGRVIFTIDVAKEYGFSDDGRMPADFRSVRDMVAASGFAFISKFVFPWLKFPLWLLKILLNQMVADKTDTCYI